MTLLDVLQREKESRLSGGIYHKVQIDLTYNSNHIEGNRLTHEQTRYIFETNTIGHRSTLNVDDVVETANHFMCINIIIENATQLLTEKLIKQLHGILKNATSDSRKDWFAIGEYKRLPNEIEGRETVVPGRVEEEMKVLLRTYNASQEKLYYYRGLQEWKNEKGYLLDTCLTAQDAFKEVIEYFRISSD